MDFVLILRLLKMGKGQGKGDAEEDNEPAEPTGLVEVYCEKLRSAGAPRPPPQVGRLVVVPMAADADGAPTGTTVRFDFLKDGKTPGQVKAVLRDEIVEQKVLDHVAKHDCASANDVIKTLKAKRDAVLRAVKTMLADGRLTHDLAGNLRPV